MHVSYEGRCRSCHARVWWLLSEANGKLAPIDTDITEGGNVLVNWETLRWRMATPEEQRTLTGLHHNHFATCTHAAQHRRR